MDIRDCILVIEDYLFEVAVEDADVQEPVSLMESVKMPRPDDAAFMGWIDCFGVEVEDSDMLVEGVLHGAPSILVEAAGEEFHASWDEAPTIQALNALTNLLETTQEFDAYFIGRMIYPMRQHALAAVKSLANNQ